MGLAPSGDADAPCQLRCTPPPWLLADHIVERDIGRREKGKFEFYFY